MANFLLFALVCCLLRNNNAMSASKLAQNFTNNKQMQQQQQATSALPQTLFDDQQTQTNNAYLLFDNNNNYNNSNNLQIKHHKSQKTATTKSLRFSDKISSLDARFAETLNSVLNINNNQSERRSGSSSLLSTGNEPWLESEASRAGKILRIISRLSSNLNLNNPNLINQSNKNSNLKPEQRSDSKTDSSSFVDTNQNNQQQNQTSESTTTDQDKRRSSSKYAFLRLASKTDWNALFVKLAKVFVQYFLDLILNDLFGTAGKFN